MLAYDKASGRAGCIVLTIQQVRQVVLSNLLEPPVFRPETGRQDLVGSFHRYEASRLKPALELRDLVEVDANASCNVMEGFLNMGEALASIATA